MKLVSDAFEDGGEIPSRFTCEAENVSPALRWLDVPPQARTLALIVDDPDAPDPQAPRRTFVHWVLYNLAPDSGGLAEGAHSAARLSGSARNGRNDWDRCGYGGPCPPIGKHRYFFKLYALDTELPDLGEPRKADLEAQMQGHVLAQAQLVGTYRKQG